MAKVPKVLHVTLSDGTLLRVNRSTRPPEIEEITPSDALLAEHGTILPATLQLVSTADSKRVPQFLIAELVTLVRVSPHSSYPVELFSGRIRKLGSKMYNNSNQPAPPHVEPH